MRLIPTGARNLTHDEHHRRQTGIGLAYGIGAYTAWGLFPMYFKLLGDTPPLVVLAHRVVWSVLFLILIIWVTGQSKAIKSVVRNRRTMLYLSASTCMIAVNWFVFIWAVMHKQVMSAALGYYINPLVVGALGVVVLGERLRPMQVVAAVLAIIGVSIMTIKTGQVPVVALLLAVSFSFYGLLRKKAAVAPVPGLFVETLLLLIPAIVMLGIDITTRDAYTGRMWLILSASGILTATPLIWFGAATQRLRLITIGLLQYIGPTLQFALAVLFFGETFQPHHALVFGCIWTAVVIYAGDSIWRMYSQRERSNEIGTETIPD